MFSGDQPSPQKKYAQSCYLWVFWCQPSALSGSWRVVIYVQLGVNQARSAVRAEHLLMFIKVQTQSAQLYVQSVYFCLFRCKPRVRNSRCRLRAFIYVNLGGNQARSAVRAERLLMFIKVPTQGVEQYVQSGGSNQARTTVRVVQSGYFFII